MRVDDQPAEVSAEVSQIRQASLLLQAERYQQAQQLLAPLIASNPEIADLWHLMAIAHYGCDDYEQAHEAITRAISLDPANATFNLMLAQILFDAGRVGECIQQATYTLQLAPNEANAHRIIALALTRLDYDRPRAVWHAERARELEPESAVSHYTLGSALLIGHSWHGAKDARESLHTALRIDPQLSEAWNCLAIAQLRRFRVVRAIRGFITALQLDPQSEVAAYNLPLAVWSLIGRRRIWMYLLLFVSAILAISSLALDDTSVVTGIISHLISTVLIGGTVWWILVYRLLRVFPQTMRQAAVRVMWRDQLVRPDWLGLVWGGIWQTIMVTVPWWHPGMIGLCCWISLIGMWLGMLIAKSRFNRRHSQLQAQRRQEWLGVVTTSQ